MNISRWGILPMHFALGKLIYSAQAEALKKCRSCRERRTSVPHDTINDGGQAVVGNMNTCNTARADG